MGCFLPVQSENCMSHDHKKIHLITTSTRMDRLVHCAHSIRLKAHGNANKIRRKRQKNAWWWLVFSRSKCNAYFLPRPMRKQQNNANCYIKKTVRYATGKWADHRPIQSVIVHIFNNTLTPHHSGAALIGWMSTKDVLGRQNFAATRYSAFCFGLLGKPSKPGGEYFDNRYYRAAAPPPGSENTCNRTTKLTRTQAAKACKRTVPVRERGKGR